MNKLSVVLPAYNEELMIEKASAALIQLLDQASIPFELVFVNDGSKDETWNRITAESKKDSRVTGVCFSRNFGKEAAIYAGLAHATGDVVAVMDCDLQHPPETLLEMYSLWKQGYEVIEGVKRSRGKESVVHRGFTHFFYQLMSRATGSDMQNTSDFKMLDRKAVDSILKLPERNMFFRATSLWIGYRSVQVSYDVREREEGESKWSTKSLIRYALNNMVSFTTVPLQLVSFVGVLCFVCSLILMIYTLVQYFLGHAVEGYSTILIVLLLLGSAIMVSLGMIGYYLGKIYEEVKQRPRYIVSETTSSQKQKKEGSRE
ncbi:MAG: glycosyltransferase family 2 protein [Eubacteriales bacterium]|nr:glycosyltransferase family 2 protein [Eubacteriales bacterium]